MQEKFGVPINKFFKHEDYEKDIMVSSIVYLEGDDTYTVCIIQQDGGTQSTKYITVESLLEFKHGIATLR
jgi:hypothetical protein